MPRKGEYKDITGMKFNRLYVLEFVEIRNHTPFWKCKCECGNETIVSGEHLKSGHTKSCGCLHNELIKGLNLKNGLSCTKLYYAYRNMINRCNWEKGEMYYRYGGRGISVCDEWLGKNGFLNFAEWALDNGYSESLTLDRIDNDKGYSPDNCRWADKFVQANNKRTTHYIKINGEVGTVANMARKYNVSYWNLLHYAKGGKNMKYPDLKIEVANESEQYQKSKGD